MTAQQLELLQRLLRADRAYRSRMAVGLTVLPEDRGVEVSWENRVGIRTAKFLVDNGLAEMIDISARANPHLFLGKFLPFDPVV